MGWESENAIDRNIPAHAHTHTNNTSVPQGCHIAKAHIHTHTDRHTHTHTHTHTHGQTHTPTRPHTQRHTCAIGLSYCESTHNTHTRTDTHTHTPKHTHTQRHTCAIGLSYCESSCVSCEPKGARSGSLRMVSYSLYPGKEVCWAEADSEGYFLKPKGNSAQHRPIQCQGGLNDVFWQVGLCYGVCLAWIALEGSFGCQAYLMNLHI